MRTTIRLDDHLLRVLTNPRVFNRDFSAKIK